MSSFNKYFSWFFFILSALHLYSRYLDPAWEIVHWVSKPLIMLSLLGYWYYNAGIANGIWNRMVYAAIIFSLLGDILLMFEGEFFFICGLGSFLIAQLCYAWCFEQQAFGLRKHMWWVGGVLILYGGSLIYILWAGLGAMKLPVSVYSIAIMLMGFAAFARRGAVSAASFIMVATGAVLFITSDSLIALNTFYKKIPLAGVWIMLTYISAQWFIIRGLLISSGK